MPSKWGFVDVELCILTLSFVLDEYMHGGGGEKEKSTAATTMTPDSGIRRSQVHGVHTTTGGSLVLSPQKVSLSILYPEYLHPLEPF